MRSDKCSICKPVETGVYAERMSLHGLQNQRKRNSVRRMPAFSFRGMFPKQFERYFSFLRHVFSAFSVPYDNFPEFSGLPFRSLPLNPSPFFVSLKMAFKEFREFLRAHHPIIHRL